MKREFEDAEGVGVADFAREERCAERAMILAAGAYDEFADSVREIRLPVGILRRKALVVVIVTIHDHRRVSGVEVLPKRLHLEVVAMRAAGTEERLVPVRESAGGGMRLQVLAQPLFLRRTRLAAADLGAFAVEYDDMPGTNIVAVITRERIACRGSEIIEIRCCAAGMKFMIAGRRACARFELSPSRSVAIVKLLRRAGGIGVVSCGKNFAGDFVEEFCSRLRAGKVRAIGDVTRADEHGIA